jgi:hypothetical protein
VRRHVSRAVPLLVFAGTAVVIGALATAAPADAGNIPTVHTATANTPAWGWPLTARTVLSGASLGLSKPDDLTEVDGKLFTAFQNGVPSTGGSAGTPTQSTVVQFTLAGAVVHRWQLTGKVDGLTADQEHHQLIATVNEDGNSSLYTIPVDGHGAPKNYRYDANPMPHGGGTDAITFYRGAMYITASAPATNNFGPALYKVTLAGDVAELSAAPFYDSSEAKVANDGHSGTVNLALTDPDSSTIVPGDSPRFAGDFNLDSQGDQQEIFVSHLGTDSQQLNVLNLSQSVDDTAWATGRGGMLVTTDNSANAIIAVTGGFDPGTAYTSVTPAAANNAPANPGPNWLGSIDLHTGTVSPVTVGGAAFQPNGLLYLADNDPAARG